MRGLGVCECICVVYLTVAASALPSCELFMPIVSVMNHVIY